MGNWEGGVVIFPDRGREERHGFSKTNCKKEKCQIQLGQQGLGPDMDADPAIIGGRKLVFCGLAKGLAVLVCNSGDQFPLLGPAGF